VPICTGQCRAQPKMPRWCLDWRTRVFATQLCALRSLPSGGSAPDQPPRRWGSGACSPAGFCGRCAVARAGGFPRPTRRARHSCDTAGSWAGSFAMVGAAQAPDALACILGCRRRRWEQLGQLFDLASYRFGALSFGQPPPETDHGFWLYRAVAIRANVWVVDLRAPRRSPQPVGKPDLRCASPCPTLYPEITPRPSHQTARVIGLPVWLRRVGRAATHLATIWNGPRFPARHGRNHPLERTQTNKICNILPHSHLTSGPALAQDEMTLLLELVREPATTGVIIRRAGKKAGYFADTRPEGRPFIARRPVRPAQRMVARGPRRTLSRFLTKPQLAF